MRFCKPSYLRPAIFLLSFVILTKFNFDSDLGLHLAYGNWFLDKGEVLRDDPFTWTLEGYNWRHAYFLFQLVVAFLFRYFGFASVVIVFGFVGALGVLILMPKKMSFQIYFSTIIGLFIAATFGGIRPHMIDFFLFCSLLVLLVNRQYEKAKFVPIWFILFAAWANLHGGYLVGLLVFTCYTFLDYLKRRMAREQIKPTVTAFSVVSAWIGTLVTPFGLNFGHSFRDYLNLDVLIYIQEFQPLVYFSPLNLLFSLSGIIFVYLTIKTGLGRDIPWLAMGLVLFALPFLAAFFCTFWAAYFIFICVKYLKFSVRLQLNFFRKLSILLVVCLVHLAIIWHFLSTIRPLDEEIRNNYPEAAVSFIADHGIDEGLFNDLAWGGYIIWKYPGIKVFIDGRDGWRMASGRSHLSEYILMLRGDCDVFAAYNVMTVLVKSDFENDCLGGLEEVYRDKLAKVLVKAD